MRKKLSVVKAELRGWWGVHYDEHGIERSRQSFQTRKEAREWVRAMKAKERGDLREKVA